MLARRNHRNWLPHGVLTGSAVADRLAGAIEAWSAAWFPHAAVRPVPSPSSMPLQEGGYWMDTALGLAIAVPATAHGLLVAQMIDAPVSKALQTAADRRIITHLAQACLDDLGLRLGVAFGLPARPAWTRLEDGDGPAIDAPRGFALGIDAKPALVTIFVDAELAIALVKASLPPAAAGDPVQPLAAGLALQFVTVAASLGRCSVTVADMAGLSVGDVLVLDRPADAPLALTIDGRTIVPAACRIGQVDDRLQLKLLEPLNR